MTWVHENVAVVGLVGIWLLIMATLLIDWLRDDPSDRGGGS